MKHTDDQGRKRMTPGTWKTIPDAIQQTRDEAVSLIAQSKLSDRDQACLKLLDIEENALMENGWKPFAGQAQLQRICRYLADSNDPRTTEQTCIECGHVARIQVECSLWACIECTRIQSKTKESK